MNSKFTLNVLVGERATGMLTLTIVDDDDDHQFTYTHFNLHNNNLILNFQLHSSARSFGCIVRPIDANDSKCSRDVQHFFNENFSFHFSRFVF